MPQEKQPAFSLNDPDHVLVLTGEAALKIFINPTRMRIVEEMSLHPAPITPKALADRLGLSPSSAKHHLMKLASIGVVLLDHQEMIHGIQASFLPPDRQNDQPECGRPRRAEVCAIAMRTNAARVQQGAVRLPGPLAGGRRAGAGPLGYAGRRHPPDKGGEPKTWKRRSMPLWRPTHRATPRYRADPLQPDGLPCPGKWGTIKTGDKGRRPAPCQTTKPPPAAGSGRGTSCWSGRAWRNPGSAACSIRLRSGSGCITRPGRPP